MVIFLSQEVTQLQNTISLFQSAPKAFEELGLSQHDLFFLKQASQFADSTAYDNYLKRVKNSLQQVLLQCKKAQGNFKTQSWNDRYELAQKRVFSQNLQHDCSIFEKIRVQRERQESAKKKKQKKSKSPKVKPTKIKARHNFQQPKNKTQNNSVQHSRTVSAIRCRKPVESLYIQTESFKNLDSKLSQIEAKLQQGKQRQKSLLDSRHATLANQNRRVQAIQKKTATLKQQVHTLKQNSFIAKSLEKYNRIELHKKQQERLQRAKVKQDKNRARSFMAKHVAEQKLKHSKRLQSFQSKHLQSQKRLAALNKQHSAMVLEKEQHRKSKEEFIKQQRSEYIEQFQKKTKKTVQKLEKLAELRKVRMKGLEQRRKKVTQRSLALKEEQQMKTRRVAQLYELLEKKAYSSLSEKESLRLTSIMEEIKRQ